MKKINRLFQDDLDAADNDDLCDREAEIEEMKTAMGKQWQAKYIILFYKK